MKLTHVALVIILSAATAFSVVLFAPATTGTESVAKEPAFERVMKSRTLRCAYVSRPPHLIVDANTKQISGIDHDLVEEIGKAAGLKIEWQEEVGYGVFPEHLNSGKQDAFCSLALISARRAQRVELTAPVAYMPLHAYARADDMRFDNNLSSLNTKDLTVAVIDGSSQKAATDAVFPNATQYALPGDSDNSQMMVAVSTRKADAVILDDTTIHDYNAHNPETMMRRIPSDKPLRTYAEAFAVAKGETQLRDLFNASIQEMVGNGIVDRIISKYEVAPGAILRVAQPYASFGKE